MADLIFLIGCLWHVREDKRSAWARSMSTRTGTRLPPIVFITLSFPWTLALSSFLVVFVCSDSAPSKF